MKKISVLLLIGLLLTACERKEYPEFIGEVTEVSCKESWGTSASTVKINNTHQFQLSYDRCRNLQTGINIKLQYSESMFVHKLELVNDEIK